MRAAAPVQPANDPWSGLRAGLSALSAGSSSVGFTQIQPPAGNADTDEPGGLSDMSIEEELRPNIQHSHRERGMLGRCSSSIDMSLSPPGSSVSAFPAGG